MTKILLDFLCNDRYDCLLVGGEADNFSPFIFAVFLIIFVPTAIALVVIHFREDDREFEAWKKDIDDEMDFIEQRTKNSYKGTHVP